ncbi:PIG-L family deacetylase [Gaetbulibacter sp. M235]|uniref:PIG-L family deacetylase n=1 Tax=Gaetbulibacter sp. M235 TaxID=3126510 RepID=UPI00374E9CB4
MINTTYKLRKKFILFVVTSIFTCINITKVYAKVYMFIHAHPDDEIYFKSGWIYDRIQSTDTLIVVIATAGDANKWSYPKWESSIDAKDFDNDGDIDMVDRGYDRMAYRSTLGLASLGLDTVNNLFFLGYADGGIYSMWEDKNSQYLNPFTKSNESPYTVNAPKYCYGLNYKTTVPYTYTSLSDDIKRLYEQYKPNCIMIPDFLDTPSDHGALGRIATQALYDLREKGNNDWVNKVEVIWSFPSHFVWANKEAWLGGSDFLPEEEGPFLAEPFPQDIFPPQVSYIDKLGGVNKCKLWEFHPYEMPNPSCFRARKNDIFRGPFVIYDNDAPSNWSDFTSKKSKKSSYSINVLDAAPGLNTKTKPQYIFSEDEGKTWKGTNGLKGYYRNKNNKTIYDSNDLKNRPETENYSYWQGDVALERIDAKIDFENEFNLGDKVNDDYWSAEWLGWVKTVDKSGTYYFYLDADDSAFLMVNNQLIVWDHGDFTMGTKRGFGIYLEKNKVYSIHLGFWDYTGYAGCKLSWKTPNQENSEIIPSSNLLCGDATIDGSDGSASIQTITALDVPFNKKSVKNKIMFMALDMAGNIGESPELSIKK